MLSINSPGLLIFPLARSDIQFWQNIYDLGVSGKTLEDNIFLHEFGIVYGSYSLFHHFAHDIDVIQTIHDMYNESIENDNLTDKDRNMPLMILKPDD